MRWESLASIWGKSVLNKENWVICRQLMITQFAVSIMRYAARLASCPPRLYFLFLGTQWNHISQRPLHFGVALWLVFANRREKSDPCHFWGQTFKSSMYTHSMLSSFHIKQSTIGSAEPRERTGSFLQPCMENGHPWPGMQHGMNKMLSPIRLRSLRTRIRSLSPPYP